MAKQAKIEEIQYMRGFAFLAVVLQHAIGHYAYLPEAGLQDGVMLAVFLIAAKFAVPLFIFITGLVLFYNYKEDIAYGAFVWKRCKDIVLPYAVWSIVYALIFGGDHLELWKETKQIALYLFTGTACYHLWYVAMVIQLYFLFPLIQKALLRIRRSCKPWQLAVGFGLLTIGYVLLTGQVSVIGNAAEMLHISVLSSLFTEYADRNALYFYLYFLMGAVVGLNVEGWKRRIMNWKASFIFIYVFISGLLLYKITASFQTKSGLVIQYNDTLLVQPFMALFLIFSVIAMSIISVIIQQSAGQWIKRMLTFLGHYSYSAYLAHALMLTAATYIADSLFPDWNVSVRTIIAFVLCTLLSVGLAVLLSRFRIGRLLSGVPAPRKPAM
ncbi:acyltransferase [Paenibacillus radicis (ex Xue et al. 2023)]|uniref:Acyltransferase n=1 Tax=Paenibacillus radicis (ex Xue et al. 2023) TaxID=2972489 RepID=A0ABT1YRA4_9BACL|nr:acyltransferase [Paenibacillus radicis (ex Xue et al. 2023)]MCR8634889.1 acyltransferase [Paenibacillus radicis (ex Xue et al. 2023)]